MNNIPFGPREGTKRLDPVSQSEGWRATLPQDVPEWERQGMAESDPSEFATRLKQHGVEAKPFGISHGEIQGRRWEDHHAGGTLCSWLLSELEDPSVTKGKFDGSVKAQLGKFWTRFLSKHPSITDGPHLRQVLRPLIVRPPNLYDLEALAQAVWGDGEAKEYDTARRAGVVDF